MTNVLPFPARKAVGDKHEDRVEAELVKRGWAVDHTAQEKTLSEQVSRALRRTESKKRHDPDFLVACGSTIRYVDAKGSLRGPRTDQNFVSRKAIAAHLTLIAEQDIPVYYVFDDLGVLTPAEVMRYAGYERLGNAPGYLAVARSRSHRFDDIFGTEHPTTWGASPLFDVA